MACLALNADKELRIFSITVVGFSVVLKFGVVVSLCKTSSSKVDLDLFDTSFCIADCVVGCLLVVVVLLALFKSGEVVVEMEVIEFIILSIIEIGFWSSPSLEPFEN